MYASLPADQMSWLLIVGRDVRSTGRPDFVTSDHRSWGTLYRQTRSRGFWSLVVMYVLPADQTSWLLIVGLDVRSTGRPDFVASDRRSWGTLYRQTRLCGFWSLVVIYASFSGQTIRSCGACFTSCTHYVVKPGTNALVSQPSFFTAGEFAGTKWI